MVIWEVTRQTRKVYSTLTRPVDADIMQTWGHRRSYPSTGHDKQSLVALPSPLWPPRLSCCTSQAGPTPSPDNSPFSPNSYFLLYDSGREVVPPPCQWSITQRESTSGVRSGLLFYLRQKLTAKLPFCDDSYSDFLEPLCLLKDSHFSLRFLFFVLNERTDPTTSSTVNRTSASPASTSRPVSGSKKQPRRILLSFCLLLLHLRVGWFVVVTSESSLLLCNVGGRDQRL